MMSLVQNHPVLSSLAMSLTINAVFFVFASLFRTDKVTDLSYTLSFFLMAPILLVAGGRPFDPIRIGIALAVMVWALRLGGYLFHRILKIGKDDRFDDKRNDFAAFLKFWSLQALTVWIVMLPVTLTLVGWTGPIGIPFLIVGFGAFIMGLLMEAISDHQKFAFRLRPENADRWVDSGLWRWSRHPNYFGEMLVWWGLFIAVAPGLAAWQFMAAVGPAFITVLLLFVSGIPLLEKSAEKKYGASSEYQAYRDRTSLLIPMPKRRIRA